MADKATFSLDVNSREGVAALKAFSDAAEHAARGGKHLEDQAHQTSRGMSAMAASFGGNLLANAAGQAAGAAAAFGRSAWQITVARDTMGNAFKALLGDAKQAEQAMALIRQAATKPGLTFDSAAAGVAKFLGTGEGLGMSVRLVTAFGNAAALSGTSVDEMAEAMRQWSQVLGRGKAEQEEVNGLLERFPSLGEQLVKQFGGRTSEAINKTSKSVADMQNKFAAAMEGMKKAPDGLANALLVLDDAYKQVQANFGKGVIGDESTRQAGRLGEALKDVAKIAKSVGEDVGKHLARGIEWATQAWTIWHQGTWGEVARWSVSGPTASANLAEDIRQRANLNATLDLTDMSANSGGPYMPGEMTPKAGSGGSTLKGVPSPLADPKAVAEKVKQDRLARMKAELATLEAQLTTWEIGHPSKGTGEMAPMPPELAMKLTAKQRAAMVPQGGFSGAARMEVLRNAIAESEGPLGMATLAKDRAISARDAAKRAEDDKARAEKELAAAKVANAQATVEYFRALLDGQEQANAGYGDMAKAIENVRSAEMGLKELRLAEAMLGASPIAQGTARMEEQREDLRIRREASERLLRAGQSTLGNQAEIAGMRAELALTPVEEAMWIDRQIAALQQKAAATAGVVGQEKEHLRTLLDIKRLQDGERGKLTRGQELLHASLGGGQGIARWAKANDGTYGEIGDRGPSFDWSRLTGTKSYRGDVVGGGVLGDVQGGIVAGMAEAASPLARAVAQATVRGMENVTRAVGVG